MSQCSTLAEKLRTRVILYMVEIDKVHLHNIYEKLKVDGRLALLRYAQEKGLV